MAIQIKGNNVLLAGAAHGIGASLATLLAKEGCNLFLIDIDKAKLAETAMSVRKEGIEPILMVKDLYGSLHEDVLGIDMESGKVVNVIGSKSSVLQKIIQKDHRVANIAEIAFGTNSWSKLGRSILEDEKKLGTAHVGFGNDTYMGGKNNGPHYDGIFLSPRIILSKGKRVTS